MTALSEEVLNAALKKLKIDICEQIEKVSDRVEVVEDKLQSHEPLSEASGGHAHLGPNQHQQVASQDTVSDVQAAFTAVQDSVNRITIDPELKLKFSAQGIKKEHRPTYDVITKSAKYPETTLKILSTLTPGEPLTEETLAKLFVVQEAQVKWLQDELANVIVSSEFDGNSRTARWFKVMQKNSSVFTPAALENLRSAASIGAIAPEPRPAGRGARFGYRSRGSYGQFRGGHRGQRGQRNRDFFSAQLDQHNIAGADNSNNTG